jgi:anti-anti-sigma regulatory factor
LNSGYHFLFYLRNVTKYSYYEIMVVKIDTKAHFSDLSPDTTSVHANMAGELEDLLGERLAAEPYNIIVVMKGVSSIDAAVVKVLKKTGKQARDAGVSFVVAEIPPEIAPLLQQATGDGALETTKTLREAVDLVMMEQLERDLGLQDDTESQGL